MTRARWGDGPLIEAAQRGCDVMLISDSQGSPNMGGRDGPTLLGGDFNIADPAELGFLDECGLQPVAPQPTFPSWRPSSVLDHLFVSPHFEMTGSRTFDRFRFSDHLPLLVDAILHPHRDSASDS